MEKKEKTRRIEDLDIDGVVAVLEKWDLHEFVEFVKEKQIDGRKLLGVTEGIVKLWRPRVNAKKFIGFIAELKAEPEKHLNFINDDIKKEVNANIEAQYQTVNVKKIREQIVTTSVGVEEILKKIVPAKSFLYRNQPTKRDKPITSYTPMDAGGTKKPKKFFRLSSYEYPHFDMKTLRFSRQENFNDRGYYSIKTNNRYYMQKIYKNPDLETKYKSLSPTKEAEMFPEEHFYEDLNYNEVDKTQSHTIEFKPHVNVKPCMVKIQELFSSFKFPFFKKPEEVEGEKKLEDVKSDVSEKDGHIYENSDSVASVYDSIHVSSQGEGDAEKQEGLPVEEYLEPVHLSKDYCDVAQKQKDDSILGYILSIFENFGMRRDTTESTPTEEPEKVQDEKPEEKPRSNMADRPLPIPVENEPYYMNIDRTEAENLLRGQPDGTFVLRPSSQPNHAYTLTVACSNEVHNVGIRRRPDGRLALGFARRGERSFSSVTSLLRHHKKRRLLLVAGGGICGATTLNDTPQYYQTPSSLPLSA